MIIWVQSRSRAVNAQAVGLVALLTGPFGACTRPRRQGKAASSRSPTTTRIYLPMDPWSIVTSNSS